jgi:hypothetical protein
MNKNEKTFKRNLSLFFEVTEAEITFSKPLQKSFRRRILETAKQIRKITVCTEIKDVML